MIRIPLTIDPTHPAVKALGGATATRWRLEAILGDLLDQLLGVAEIFGPERLTSFAELLDLVVDGAHGGDDGDATAHVHALAELLVTRADVVPLLEAAIGAQGEEQVRALDAIAEARGTVARRAELAGWIAGHLPEDPQVVPESAMRASLGAILAGSVGEVVPAEPHPKWGPRLDAGEEPLTDDGGEA